MCFNKLKPCYQISGREFTVSDKAFGQQMGYPISVKEGSHYWYIFLFAEIFEPLEFSRTNSVLSVKVVDLFSFDIKIISSI